MKKYVNILDLALLYLYGRWDIKKSEHRLHIVSGTWKNSKFSPSIWVLSGKIPHLSFLLGSETWKNFDLHPYIYIYGDRLWNLEKILSPASIQALGFEKMLSFLFLRLQPVGETPSVARFEVSLSCLLHISSKLFLLTYSSKP